MCIHPFQQHLPIQPNALTGGVWQRVPLPRAAPASCCAAASGHGCCWRGCVARHGGLQPPPTHPLPAHGMPFAGITRCGAQVSAPASPAAPGHRRVQSIGDTITVSLNCFFTAAAPGCKRVTVKIICRRAVDKTLLIVSCKFGTGTSTFVSHPGSNIPSHPTGRRGEDMLQALPRQSCQGAVGIQERFFSGEIRALRLPKVTHEAAAARGDDCSVTRFPFPCPIYQILVNYN